MVRDFAGRSSVTTAQFASSRPGPTSVGALTPSQLVLQPTNTRSAEMASQVRLLRGLRAPPRLSKHGNGHTSSTRWESSWKAGPGVHRAAIARVTGSGARGLCRIHDD